MENIQELADNEDIKPTSRESEKITVAEIIATAKEHYKELCSPRSPYLPKTAQARALYSIKTLNPRFTTKKDIEDALIRNLEAIARNPRDPYLDNDKAIEAAVWYIDNIGIIPGRTSLLIEAYTKTALSCSVSDRNRENSY